MRAAYADLPPTLREELDRTRIVHSFNNYVVKQSRVTQSPVWDPRRLRDPRTGERGVVPLEVSHPAVRVHDRTGRRALYLSDPRHSFGGRVDGRSLAESLPLYDQLLPRATRPANCYRHRWSRGDVLMWDNQSVLHFAPKDYDGSVRPRISTRTTVQGDRPVGIDGSKSYALPPSPEPHPPPAGSGPRL